MSDTKEMKKDDKPVVCKCGKTNGWMIATIVLTALLAASVALNVVWGLERMQPSAVPAGGNMQMMPQGQAPEGELPDAQNNQKKSKNKSQTEQQEDTKTESNS